MTLPYAVSFRPVGDGVAFFGDELWWFLRLNSRATSTHRGR